MERKRLVNWWIRWEDLNWPNPDSMEYIRKKAYQCAEANITSAVIFGCHFRWDYLPYFTILHDYLATVAEELGKYGIELIDHHSVNLIHRYDTPEQMRHVMLHSGPHIPFSPSREAAANWTYNGKRLNDWRMVDVKTGKPFYFPQYAGEGFCHRNPEFMEAYQDYAVKLVKDTGIKGLMADDAMYYGRKSACGCYYCRQELKRRAGIDLPPMEDQSFWGNWDNPAWKHWVDLRFDATAQFHKALREKLPEEFTLMSCGAPSATAAAIGSASDARKFLGGCNYVNMELSGNTPPYKNDPVTVNHSIAERMINASHHQAAAREKGVRCYATGYGFTEATANIIWAVNKMLDSDCHFSTLKPRLGLPISILSQLPEAEDVVKTAYTFEKEHPYLFNGKQVGQLGVYFSYETRNHTCFGSLEKGYIADYSETLKQLFRAGISAHTLFTFPEDAEQYPLVLVPSPASMTEEEIASLQRYTKAGGIAVITGPSAYPGCEHSWKLPASPDTAPADFFSTIRNGVWMQLPKWMLETKLPESADPQIWQEPATGIYYNPHRLSDGKLTADLISFCKKWGNPMPVQVQSADGYFVTVYQGQSGVTVQFLAEEYDTDIDHKLDEMRFHRSRVNYIDHVEPIGVSGRVQLQAKDDPQVYLPFSQESAQITRQGDTVTVTLPDKCAYGILHFPNA